MSAQQPANILVIRNDKLGDFMLAWPALSLLKQQYPESRITVLIPSYTQPVAELCPWIDDIIIDQRHGPVFADCLRLTESLRNKKFDAAISLFSEFRVGLALWLARIPLRLAPATKLARIFYNRKLVQRRSRSEKPEYIYNVDLIRHFIRLGGEQPGPLAAPPFLKFNPDDTNNLKTGFIVANDIPAGNRLVFVHPGSGGSATNLSVEQYATLIKDISASDNIHFVITAGPGELDIATQLSDLLRDLLSQTTHTLYHSTDGLAAFAKLIAACDLFISGSTGPLHIAGALNVNTAAFYPARRSATSLRWETVNEQSKRLSFMPDSGENESNMSTINVNDCAKQITEKFLT